MNKKLPRKALTFQQWEGVDFSSEGGKAEAMLSRYSGERQRADEFFDELTIGQLAHLTGVPAKSIRYYESVGLLPAPERRENGYRRYRQADVNRLILLRRMRLLGVPLAAMSSLVMGTSHAHCAQVQQEVLALIRDRLAALDQEIAELHLLREQVKRYSDLLIACPADPQTSFDDCSDLCCLAFSGGPAQQEEEVSHACPCCS
jgi:MerR family copper efflux transcriptional regulator